MIIEMILSVEGSRTKCFANIRKRYNEEMSVVAHKAVLTKMREFPGNVEIIEVTAAGVDVTKEVLEMREGKLEYNKLDDEIPF